MPISLRIMKAIDLSGKQFNQLTVLSFAGSKKRGKRNRRYWNCKCSCGVIKDFEQSQLCHKHIKTCGCIKIGKKHKSWCGVGDISGTIWKRIVYKAKERKIEFNITLEQVWQLYVKQNKRCAITGLPISFPIKAKSRKFNASLDRIDSKKGYTIDNVQWVLRDINWIKNKLDQDYFIELCGHVTKHQNNLV
jgi:hypothetical protein